MQYDNATKDEVRKAQLPHNLFISGLICIDLSIFKIMFQCMGSRTDGMPTVDQSDMRGLVTA